LARLFFYLRYAFQNLRRSGQWTSFAVFCVAAGVATVVALRSLGLSIGDSLLTNLREINRGDITLRAVGGGPFSFSFNQGEEEQSIFTPRDIERVAGVVAAYGGQMTTYAIYNNVQITALDYDDLSRPQFVTTLFIDPASYAITGDTRALEPAGVPLRDLFTGGPDVVISQNLAEAQGLTVGEQVRITGTDRLFTVRGIVPTSAEANVNNLAAAFFGFAYIDNIYAPLLQLNPAPNQISIVLPPMDGTQLDEIGLGFWHMRLWGLRSLQTTNGLLTRNQEVADLVGRFIVVLGLGALLIGGVGIVNTMLVMVGRRTMEIASLKTFGLKGRQVAALFISEAFLLGLAGSGLGVVVGLLLSLAANRYGEALLQQPLAWRLHPEAIWYGLGLGMVVTMVFGVLPVLIAAHVRPAIILRPNQAHLPRASLPQVLGALSIVVVVLGGIAGQIIGPLVVRALGESRAPNPYLLGMAGVAVTLLVLLALVGVLWAVVWFVSRLPSFGSVDLRLALRNMTAGRIRTATTLLALSAGMFALSSISFFGLGARQIVEYQFSETLGGNVLVVPLLRGAVTQQVFDRFLALQDEIVYNTRMSGFGLWLDSVDGAPIRLDGRPSNGVRVPGVIRETNHPYLRSGVLVAGRDLMPEDYGQRVIVLSEQSLLESAVREFTLEDLGIGVGSTVGVRYRNFTADFEVVGIVSSLSGILPNFGGAFIPPGVMTVDPLSIHVLQVEAEHLNAVLQGFSRYPFILALDMTFVDSLLVRLIEQMSAIPTIVGLLSLLAAAVIMANTVSLATLERRHQIGILKTIGLRRQRVLRVMLLENTVIGLLGAGLGIAVSALGVSIMTSLGMGVPVPLPGEALPVALALLAAAVVIAWLSTFLSARVAINERVAQVLRYE
jgi:putative ABC transport system permease protein